MPKRDFPTLLTAFLAVAAAGAATGGPKEAKAAIHGPADVIVCDDEFCQFLEAFDQFSESLPFQEFFDLGPVPFFEDFFQVV